MKLQRSPFFFGIFGAAFLGSVIILLVYWKAIWLPHPDQANLNQLFYWLVSRDLSEQPIDLRRALLLRLEEEAEKNTGTSSEQIELPEDYQEQLAANVLVLRDDWFAWQLERYSALTSEQRPALVRKCLESVELWLEFQARLGGQATQEGVVEIVEELAANVPPAQQDLAQALISDAVVHWLSQKDLGQFGLSLRTDLATRIAAELDTTGVTPEMTQGDWSDEQMNQLRCNGELLMEAWVLNQAEEFGQLPDERQDGFVRMQIDKVQRWGVLNWLLGVDNDADLGLSALLKLNQLLSQWTERAEENRKDDLRRLASKVRKQLVADATKPR